MRIVSWNIAHQTKPRPMKPGFAKVIGSLRPDVLFLNEYAYDDRMHAPMLEELRDLGLSHWMVSEHLSRPPVQPGDPPKPNNQVLAVSRTSLEAGDLRGPVVTDRGGETNFLHVRPEGLPFEIVGIRAPAYDGAMLASYWDQLGVLVAQVASRPIVFIGDFNGDPERPQYPGGSLLSGLRQAGWHLPVAEGLWSYRTGTRIDHVLASQQVAPPTARYVVEEGGILLAGKASQAISDHAALVVDIPTA